MADIKKLYIDLITDEAIVNRFNTLIELFRALGIK